MSASTRPPRWAERVLGFCLGSSADQRTILGDLHEEYVMLVRTRATVLASIWYMSQIPQIGLWYLGCRVFATGRAASSRSGLLRRVIDGTRLSLSDSVRGLTRHPGFSAAVVLTLALGLGANATMFGVVDRLLLSPP